MNIVLVTLLGVSSALAMPLDGPLGSAVFSRCGPSNLQGKFSRSTQQLTFSLSGFNSSKMAHTLDLYWVHHTLLLGDIQVDFPVRSSNVASLTQYQAVAIQCDGIAILAAPWYDNLVATCDTQDFRTFECDIQQDGYTFREALGPLRTGGRIDTGTSEHQLANRRFAGGDFSNPQPGRNNMLQHINIYVGDRNPDHYVATVDDSEMGTDATATSIHNSPE